MKKIVLVQGKNKSRKHYKFSALRPRICKLFSQFFFLTLENFFLTVRYNNYGNKIPDPKHTSYGIANAIHLSLRPSTSSVVNCATNCFLESLFIIGIRTLFPLILVNSWGLPSSKDFAQEALKNRALTIKNAVSGDTLSEI